MTEERFTFNGYQNTIEYDGKSILLDSYGEKIADLLNSQAEQIQELDNKQFKTTHTIQNNIRKIIKKYQQSHNLTRSEQLLIQDLLGYLYLNIEKLSLEIEEMEI